MPPYGTKRVKVDFVVVWTLDARHSCVRLCNIIHSMYISSNIIYMRRCRGGFSVRVLRGFPLMRACRMCGGGLSCRVAQWLIDEDVCKCVSGLTWARAQAAHMRLGGSKGYPVGVCAATKYYMHRFAGANGRLFLCDANRCFSG